MLIRSATIALLVEIIKGSFINLVKSTMIKENLTSGRLVEFSLVSLGISPLYTVTISSFDFPGEKARILSLALDARYVANISKQEVDDAREVITAKIDSEGGLLLVVSAINLLNAAIKKEQFKKELTYREIKGNISRLLSFLSRVPAKRFNASFWINPDEGCAYIEVSGFQFSFHNITMGVALKAFTSSDRNQIRQWCGIRLQRVAGDVFRYSVKKAYRV